MLMTGSVAASTEQTGANFEASLEYAHLGGAGGLLTVNMTNISSPSVGGFLTGLVFNVGSADAGASIHLASSSNAFFNDAAGAPAQPFGPYFIGGASLGHGGAWFDGGPPQRGIAAGDSASFEFAITALDAASLTAESFIEGPYDYNFVARFRGLNGGLSDKVPVPAPGAATLLGLAGAYSLRRRR